MAAKGNQQLFNQALEAEGITGPVAELARSIYFQESGGGRNTKTSNAGAVGGMQIIPSTFKSVADKGWDINDPMANARAGIRYVGKMVEAGGGDLRLAAVGYYGGPGAIAKAKKGIAVNDPRNPKAPNTFQYADQVVSRMGGGATQVAAAGVSKGTGTAGAGSYSPAPDDQDGDPVAGLAAALNRAPPKTAAQAPDAWQAFLTQMDASVKAEKEKQMATSAMGLNQDPNQFSIDSLDFTNMLSKGPAMQNVNGARPMMSSFQDWLS